MGEKIKAFNLRKKTSRAGRVYYAAPLGDVDLVGYVDEKTGDIQAFYCQRDVRPATGAYTRPQARSEPSPGYQKPKITPRPQPLTGYAPDAHAPRARGYAPSQQPPNLYEEGDPGPDPSDYGF